MNDIKINFKVIKYCKGNENREETKSIIFFSLKLSSKNEWLIDWWPSETIKKKKKIIVILNWTFIFFSCLLSLSLSLFLSIMNFRQIYPINRIFCSFYWKLLKNWSEAWIKKKKQKKSWPKSKNNFQIFHRRSRCASMLPQQNNSAKQLRKDEAKRKSKNWKSENGAKKSKEFGRTSDMFNNTVTVNQKSYHVPGELTIAIRGIWTENECKLQLKWFRYVTFELKTSSGNVLSNWGLSSFFSFNFDLWHLLSSDTVYYARSFTFWWTSSSNSGSYLSVHSDFQCKLIYESSLSDFIVFLSLLPFIFRHANRFLIFFFVSLRYLTHCLILFSRIFPTFFSPFAWPGLCKRYRSRLDGLTVFIFPKFIIYASLCFLIYPSFALFSSFLFFFYLSTENRYLFSLCSLLNISNASHLIFGLSCITFFPQLNVFFSSSIHFKVDQAS